MTTGTVKTLLHAKGFGFIAPDDASGQGTDLFFHHSALRGGHFDDIQLGQRVEFDSEPDPRNVGRYRATNVTLLED